METSPIDADLVNIERYRLPLLAGALYDGLLGLAFLFFAGPLFALLGIAMAADPVYVQLAAGLVAIMGFGLYLAWRDPLLDGDIVLMGVVFKAFYIALALYALATGGLPHWIFLLLAAIDLVFLIVFVLFLRDTSDARAALARSIPGRSSP